MDVLGPVLVIAGVIAVFTLIIWLLVGTVRRNRSMRDKTVGTELARLAEQRGWSYTPELQGYPERYTYPPFRGVHGESAYDLVTGTHRGRSFTCFQYRVPRSQGVGGGPLEQNYVRVFTVALPATVPMVMVTGARMNPKWTRTFTTGDDAFDDEFTVATKDEGFAHRVLTEPVKRWLRTNPPLAGMDRGGVRLVGDEAIGWYPEKGRFDVGTIEPALDYLCDLLDRIPADAVR